MSTSRVKTWVYEKLLYTDLNAEFDNLVNAINTVDAKIPTITSFAKTILDDLSASAVKTTLGIALGTGAGTFCEGNDSRLSDTRTPTDGSVVLAKLTAAEGTTSTTNTTQTPFVMTGGAYCFHPTFSVTSGGTVTHTQSTSTSTSAVALSGFAASSGATATATWRYFEASPPYDLGDGEVKGFLYLMIDEITGEIKSVWLASNPPWYTGKNKEDKLEGMEENPQPFPELLDGQRVIMADPMSDKITELFERRKNGEHIGQLFFSGELKIGKKVDRSTPPGVDAYEIK